MGGIPGIGGCWPRDCGPIAVVATLVAICWAVILAGPFCCDIVGIACCGGGNCGIALTLI